MAHHIILVTLLLMAGMVGSACQNSEFSGQNGEKGHSGPGGSSGEGQSAEQSFQGPGIPPVDILFVMDTSGSMREEKQYLESNMNQFVSKLMGAQVDARILALGGGVPDLNKFPRGGGNCGAFKFSADLPSNRFGVVPVYVHSYDAIGQLNRFFAGDFVSQTPIKFRQNAPLEIIIISDDDGNNQKELQQDPTIPPRNMATDFNVPAGRKTTVHAIVGKSDSVQVPQICEIENTGEQAMALAKDTGGTVMDICSQDWSALLDQLSQQIIDNNKGYQLDAAVDSSKPVTVTVNGKVLDIKHYRVDYDSGFISILDTATIKSGDEIRVQYSKKN